MRLCILVSIICELCDLVWKIKGNLKIYSVVFTLFDININLEWRDVFVICVQIVVCCMLFPNYYEVILAVTTKLLPTSGLKTDKILTVHCCIIIFSSIQKYSVVNICKPIK